MNIGFDGKRFFNNFTGLGNYSRFVVSALSQHPENHELYLFTPRARTHPDIDSIVSAGNVHTIEPSKWYKKTKTTSVWRTWTQSYHQAIEKLDVYHGLSGELPLALPAHIKRVVTVHDLIFLRFPKFYNPVDVHIYKTKVKSACNRAHKIVAISEQTKDDIVSFLNISPEKIDVVYQGVHPIFKKTYSEEEIRVTRKKHKLPDRYILQVGTIEERKNTAVLLRALAEISEPERIPVVIMGRATPYKKKLEAIIDDKNLSRWVIFLHEVPFTDFPLIYKAAELFIYPSLFEGFGIPLVEAIACKVPVITSTGSCFHEAAGPDSLYFDSGDYQALATHIIELLKNQSKRDRMINESFQYISKFSSPVIANDLISVYKSII